MNVFNILDLRKPIKSGPSLSDADVSLGRIKSKKVGKQRFVFTFRNDVFKLICPKQEKVNYKAGLGVIGFIKSNDNTGWTFTSKSDGRATIQVTPYDEAERKFFDQMIGDYDLNFDDETGFYYIQMGGRK